MFSFQHIEYLTGLAILIPLVIIFRMALYRKVKVRKALGDAALIDQLTKRYSSQLYQLKFIVLLTALVFAIFALANFRKAAAGDNERKAGIDVMIALDVSKSMWSEDVKPSRLDKAKQFINLLIDRLGDNRIGFVVFAGQSFLQMPLTSDAVAAKIFVSNASPDAVPVQGTAIGDALQLCDNSFNTKEKKYKAVVLISDGEDHDNRSKNLLQQLYDHGVIVNTVGVGSPEGSPIIEPGTNSYKMDANGQTVITRLNEKGLQEIAQKTGGIYRHLDNGVVTSAEIMESLNNMDKKLIDNNINSTKQYASFYPLFLALALLMLTGEIFIPETKKQTA